MTTKLLTINYDNLEPLAAQMNQYNLLTQAVYLSDELLLTSSQLNKTLLITLCT